MSRYIQKQRHRHTCGLVSVINALKWLGRPKNYLKVYHDYIRKGIKVDSVVAKEFEIFLDDAKVEYTRVTGISVHTIEDMLDEGHGVILFYKYYLPDPEGHFVFIDEHSPDRFVIHNPSRRVRLENKDKMQALLDHNHERNTEVGMWVIYKD